MTKKRILQYAYALDKFHVGYSHMIKYMLYKNDDFTCVYDDLLRVITYLCNLDKDNIFKKDMPDNVEEKDEYIQNAAMKLFEYFKEVNHY